METIETQVKRGRGRPRKDATVVNLVEATPGKTCFTFKNVQTVVQINYDEVRIEAETEEEAIALLQSQLQNNAWSVATEPIQGELNIIEYEAPFLHVEEIRYIDVDEEGNVIAPEELEEFEDGGTVEDNDPSTTVDLLGIDAMDDEDEE